jgi:hypothetical protein
MILCLVARYGQEKRHFLFQLSLSNFTWNNEIVTKGRGRVIANGCLRKEARREHLDYINKGLLSNPYQGAKLALAHCDRNLVLHFPSSSRWTIFFGSVKDLRSDFCGILCKKKNCTSFQNFEIGGGLGDLSTLNLQTGLCISTYSLEVVLHFS